MFTNLKYDIHFQPTPLYPTGRRLKEDHDMFGGFGAIIGPNEAGKSMVLEVARFLMFGAKALRGKAADYLSFTVSGDLKVRDMELRIEKTLTTAKLFIDGQLVVKGTAPVNNRLREIFGFGLQVFDVANSINQGEIEKLQDMRPAERAKLIGGVVGLDKIDDLMKYAGEVALGHDRAANTVEAVLTAPVQPFEPEGYPNRTILADFLYQAEKDQRELDLVRGQLMAPAPVEPQAPGPCPVTLAEADLLEMIAANTRHRALTAELERLPTIDVPAAEAALDAYEAWTSAQAFLRNNPAPAITLAEATKALEDYDILDQWETVNTQRQLITQLEHQLAHLDEATCPSCDYTFTLDAELASNIGDKLEEARKAFVEPSWVVEKPLISRHAAGGRVESDAHYAQVITDRAAAEAVPEAPAPQYSRFDLQNYKPTRRAEIDAELATLDVMWQAEEMLTMLRGWQASSDTYAERLATYTEAAAERARLEERRTYCSYAPDRLAELRPVVNAFKPYEEAKVRYETEMATYDLRLNQIAQMREKAEQWRAAKDALGRLRTEIKQHLYPSLAKAASILLAGMTNGARRTVEIDDEFDVMIDGQRLDTLSGSGKAVANLSIRLGLGQVLTHRSLPIIFADEIDASMDATRATATQDIIHQCARRVSQLVMVSHKTPVADWYIELGANRVE